MAKIKLKGRRLQTREKMIESAIENIREYHQLGHELAGKGKRNVYDEHVIEDHAARLHFTPDYIWKARQFADPRSGFSEAELDTLCEKLESIQGGQDQDKPVFGRTHIMRLMALPTKEQKIHVAMQAIEKAWSIRVLMMEIRRRNEPLGLRGRRRSIPEDHDLFFVHLEGVCDKWRRWRNAIERNYNEAQERRKKQKDASPLSPCAKLMATIVEACKDLDENLDAWTAKEIKKEGWPGDDDIAKYIAAACMSVGRLHRAALAKTDQIRRAARKAEEANGGKRTRG
ncbi:MAG: hypothetical protein WCL32_17420 [Planctomycetota bacterium]